MIYLDHAATAPPKREVLEAMWPWLTRNFGNPASHHEVGVAARMALDDARESIAELLGVHASEITFTSGGTEADNAAVKGIAMTGLDAGRRHLVVSAIEHSAVLESARWLRRFGIEVTEVGVDRFGRIDPGDVAAALRDDTSLVSIHYANNEVGTVQPLADIAEVVHARGIPFHTDAVQAAGWLPLAVHELGVDAVSLAGHKIGTPHGIGALYVSGRTAREPLIHGGGQQDGQRSGTENTAGAVGLAAALRICAESVDERAWHLESLRDRFIAHVEELGGELTGHRSHRLPGHASFVFPGRSGESILVDLEARGIICSSGSACASGRDEPSHVLMAMGHDREVAQSAVRFTFDDSVSGDDLDRTVHALATTLERT